MTKSEAGSLGGSAPHHKRGLEYVSAQRRREISKTGVQTRVNNKLIREIDDLALVQCPSCLGANPKRQKCRKCNGTGDIVVHQTKYYTKESV